MERINKKICFIAVGIIILIIMVGGILFQQKQSELNLYKIIIYTSSQVSEVSVSEQKANSYYDEVSFFYEKRDFKGVESNCRLARDYYSDASQRYREIRSELQQADIKDNLINIYLESLKVLSEIQFNMYESCEHLEAASRYYDTYFNTDVPYDDISYDMGMTEIDAMNEKIRLHDENVRKYNDLLADFNTELKRRFK